MELQNIYFKINQIKQNICSIKIFEYKPLRDIVFGYDKENILNNIFEDNFTNEETFKKIVEIGDLLLLELFHYNNSKLFSDGTMDIAAENGHLNVVEWLHNNIKEGCTTHAMIWAAMNGHLEVIEWLHKNRKEGCTTGAMNLAAANGHLNVVEWLHNNRKEGCTTGAIAIIFAHVTCCIACIC